MSVNKISKNTHKKAIVFGNERVQQSLPNRVWELLVWASRCPKAKLRSKLAARVAQDRPKRGQEGP